MAIKRCPKCGGSWSSALKLCAFCGVEGVEEAAPAEVKLPAEQKKPPEPEPVPQPEPEKEPKVAVETAPPPPPEETPAESPAEVKLPEEPRRPLPDDTPRRLAAIANLTPMPGPGPKVPFTKAAIGFSLLGVLACLSLPASVLWQTPAWISNVGFLLSGVLAPFAAVGWILASRHLRKCREIDVSPEHGSGFARAAGAAAMVVFLFEVSLLFIVVGILRITGHLPHSFLGPHAGG